MGLIITGGSAKGRKLRTLGTTNRQVRPTSGKIREALFSIIGPGILNSTFLDLFAGYGTVGLEALSRGAASADLVEFHPATFNILKSNATHLGLEGVRLWKKNATEFPVKKRVYDFVFIDPPFQLDFNSFTPLILKWKNATSHLIVQYPTRAEPEWVSTADSLKKYGESGLCIFYN